MKYDVTIGIPVYESVDVIKRSLESALAQTYSSIEFLIVDDCGSDGSMAIVQQLQTKHPRGADIHVVRHTQNLGVSAARNRIIDDAQGDYLYFLDSDDMITENTIELMMQNIRWYDAEIVFGSYERVETTGRRTVYQYSSLQLLHEDELAVFAYRKYAGIQASACNYLVKTSLLREHHHRFIDTNYWEDLVFTFDLVTLVKRAVLLPDITYTYLCREGSLSHYQQRQQISREEIMNNVHAIDYLKQPSSYIYNKVYYPNRCVNIVLTDFYIACYILKRRKGIIPYINNFEIKSIMRHPAEWSQIVHFKHSRLKNVLLFLIGRMPSYLCVATIYCCGKMKKLL